MIKPTKIGPISLLQYKQLSIEFITMTRGIMFHTVVQKSEKTSPALFEGGKSLSNPLMLSNKIADVGKRGNRTRLRDLCSCILWVKLKFFE
mmetsp:Transcript_25415/g.74836  ORF Transcript_25415/g.74836 Transcript_25415/m.74836 type:complete len:91 (-) Transcript_25415:427-699(-)